MSKLTSKFISIATTATVMAMMIAPSVAAVTAEELQVQINDLLATLATLQAQLGELDGSTTGGGEVPADCVGVSFDRNLKQGMSGSDVKCMQALLNTDADTQLASSGAGSPGNETMYFGPITKAGVIKFQELYASSILASWGLTSGTGFVGSTTRAKLDEILAAGTGTEPPEGCECTAWANDVCGGGSCLLTRMQQTRTCTPLACAVETQCITDASCSGETPSAGIAISLASDTPAARAVAKGAYDRIMTKIRIAAGETVTISSIAIKRDGVSSDTDVTEIEIYDGETRLGSAQALNTVTHKATFSNLSWSIAAGQTKVLTIKVNIGTAALPGNQVNIGIHSASDIVTVEGATVSGAPIYGNSVSIAGTSVGVLDVEQNDNSVSGTVISGATDQKVGSFKFTADTVEGFDVEEISLTEIGTSVDGDISNVVLKYLGTTLGTVSELTDGKATFIGSPLFVAAAGTAKDIDIYVDVATGVISERTVRFEVTEYPDVTAVGQNTGGVVKITLASGATAYTVQQSSEWTIKQGSLTVTLDGASTPAATSYVKGSSQVSINALKFSAGSREGLKITKLKLTKSDGTVANTDVIDDSEFQSVQLYVDGVSLGYIGSVSSGVVTFTNADGIFTVPKSGNTVVMIKANITTAADAGDKLGFYINGFTQIEMKGISSDAKVQSTVTTVVESSIDAGTETTAHTVVATGNLTVTSAPDSPAAQSITFGQDDLELMRFRLTAEYEDMRISSVKARIYNDASAIAAGTNNRESTTTDILANMQLYDGDTLLNEQGSPSAGYVTFSTNFIVEKGTTKTLKIVSDIPSTVSSMHKLGLSVGAKSGEGITTGAELTTTGLSSSQDIGESGGALSNNFTIQIPTLTINVASVPPSQQAVSNSSEKWLGRLQLTGTYEDVKITRVIIGFDNASAINGPSSAEDVFTNVIIKVGNTQIGTTKQVTNGATGDRVTFDGIGNLTIGEDQTISLDIYADVTATSTDTNVHTWYVGHASDSDIVGSGVYSNTTVNSSGEKKASKGLTVRSSGTLTVAVDADTPVDANLAVGTNGTAGVVFSKFKFEALYEDMLVTNLKLTLTDADDTSATSTSGDYDIDKVYLYDGSTPLGESPVDTTLKTVNFVNEAGLFTVPNGGSKIITVKADVFGVNTGALTGDSPRFYIDAVADTTQVRGLGASSNSSTTASADSADNPQTYTNFGSQYLYKTAVTVAKNASSPSGASSAGAGKELLRFDMTADSQADAVLNVVALTISGSVNGTGDGDASLYKSTDTATTLATEVDRTVSNVEASSAAVSATTADVVDWTGIPAGASLRIYDADQSGYMTDTVRLTKIASSTEAQITFTTASANIGDDDDFYYRPAEAGPGKLYFGARTYLYGDASTSATVLFVADASGFAVGDVVKFANAYSSTGTATTWSSGCVVKGFDTTATPNSIEVTACVLVGTGNINYNYHVVTSATDAYVEYAVAYASGSSNEIGEAIAAGTSKTFVVKGDTTGATAAQTLSVSIAAGSDLNWDDKVQESIANTRTQAFPVQTTLTY